MGSMSKVFLEIPHNATQGKNLDVFIFPLLKNMCCKIIASIKYEMIGIVIVYLLVYQKFATLI